MANDAAVVWLLVCGRASSSVWLWVCFLRGCVVVTSCVVFVSVGLVSFFVLGSRLSIRAGFQMAGRREVSSRLFMLCGRFSISMASLIILLLKCSLLAMVLVFLKSISCPVALRCWTREDVGSSFLTEFLCSSMRALILLLVCPMYVVGQVVHGISYTP